MILAETTDFLLHCAYCSSPPSPVMNIHMITIAHCIQYTTAENTNIWRQFAQLFLFFSFLVWNNYITILEFNSQIKEVCNSHSCMQWVKVSSYFGPSLTMIINRHMTISTLWKKDLSSKYCFHWALVIDIWNVICTSYKLGKCDLLVIHWINAHSANAASKVPAGVHSNRGNNLHVFTGATVCWLANALLELFSDVCLSA